MDLIRSIIDKTKRNEDIKNKYFYLETETTGFLPFNTASVKIKAFGDKQKMHKLNNLAFQWFRLIEGRNYELENKSDTYHFSAEDIGNVVIATVKNLDVLNEVEAATFGPVVFDPQIKVDVEKLAIEGSGSFDVMFPYKETSKRLLDQKNIPDPDEIPVEELRITISEIKMVLKDQQYSIPLTKCSFENYVESKDVVKAKLNQREPFLDHFDYTQDDEGHYQILIKFLSRVQKEIFLVALKIFATVKMFPLVKNLGLQEISGPDKKIFSKDSKNSLGELLVLYDNLKDTLKRNVSYTKSVLDDRDQVIKYSESLEDELKMTLKDLKDAFNKARLGKAFDVSKIDKVENSIMMTEMKIKERSFKNDKMSNKLTDAAKYKKNKEELDKMTKLNELLASELKKVKQAQKDRFKKINNSLNHIKDLSVIPDHLYHNTQMQPSFKFDTMDKEKSMTGDHSLNNSQMMLRNIDLMRENEALKNELYDIKVKRTTNNEPSVRLSEKAGDADFYLKCFEELRSKINDIVQGKSEVTQNLSFTFIDDSVLENVQKAGMHNKVELLNVENASLNRRISYLLKEIQRLRSMNLDSSIDRMSMTSDTEFRQLQIKMEELKRENQNLMKEIRNFEAVNEDSLEIYKRQNAALRAEVDSLRQTSIEREQEFQKQIDIKDELIDKINDTNNSLIDEVKRLQGMVAPTRSFINTSKSFTDK